MNSLDKNNSISVGGTRRSHPKRRSLKKIKSPYFKDSEVETNSEKMKLDSCRNLDSAGPVKLNNFFFQQPCIALAKNLLGKMLVRKLPTGKILKGIIMETESYLGVIDMASHSFNGKRTERNEAMYLKPGTAYVYTIYGIYYCFNISSLEEGSAVLIRALEPCYGQSTMQEFRSKRRKNTDIKTKDLCNGPSKLCQAFQIDKDLNKADLCFSNNLWLEEGIFVDISNIISCKRIGIDSYGEEWANKCLRFYVKHNYCVSHRNKTAEMLHSKATENLNS